MTNFVRHQPPRRTCRRRAGRTGKPPSRMRALNIVLASPKEWPAATSTPAEQPGEPDLDGTTHRVRSRRGRQGAACRHRAAGFRLAGGFRHGVLSGRPWPDVGSGRRQALDRADRVVRAAGKLALVTCAGRAAACGDVRRQAAGGQEGPGLHQHRRRRGADAVVRSWWRTN